MSDTPYDRVAYPSAIFERTHPERLAVLATLHGLAPPAVETARVLEVGCGDGMNLLAFAAAYPNATFEGFDLAPSPVARAQQTAAEAGLTNITFRVLNALDAPATYPRESFDYVIAHGVYAWVPSEVRDAIMRLLGHALSPHGIGFLSYNAMPGGYMRQIMRDMLLLEVGEIADPDAKMAATAAFLDGMKDMDTRGDPSVEAIRAHALSMMQRSPALLFHDELGTVFEPQSVLQVTAAAEEVGLRFLSDAGRNHHFDGFFDAAAEMPADPERAIVRSVQMDDYLRMTYFRQTVLVRAQATPSRVIDTTRMDGLWVSSKLAFDPETNTFAQDSTKLDIEDEEFAQALLRIVEAGVTRLPISGLVDDPQRRAILLRLYNEWYVQLHTGPPTFATVVSERPLSSPLVRAEIARGDMRLCSLDHRIIEIEQAGLRSLLAAATGERTMDEIAATVDVEFARDRIPAAYEACVQRALMLR